MKNKDSTPPSINISPNIYIDNLQEYKSLEPVSRLSEDSGGKIETGPISGADWTGVFEEFKNTIIVRHYSRATLKNYTGWVRKFLAFTESKDPTLLKNEDVKGFFNITGCKKESGSIYTKSGF
jgi:hypothetical protein